MSWDNCDSDECPRVSALGIIVRTEGTRGEDGTMRLSFCKFHIGKALGVLYDLRDQADQELHEDDDRYDS